MTGEEDAYAKALSSDDGCSYRVRAGDALTGCIDAAHHGCGDASASRISRAG
jgi:hypothetical protein